MYELKLPFKDLKDKPRNTVVHFNLFEREVFKLLVEFQAIFAWQEKLQKADPNGVTDTAEVIEFYNNLEEILLAAYGEPDADDLHFYKAGRYKFEESVMFNACMKLFVEDQLAANALIDGLMPKGLQELVQRADASLAEMAKSDATDAQLRAEIDKLRAQISEQTSEQKAS